MKPLDYVAITVKMLFLTLWLIPVPVHLWQTLPKWFHDAVFSQLWLDFSAMLLATILAVVPAVATSLALSVGSRVTAKVLLALCFLGWLLPVGAEQQLWSRLALIDSSWWYHCIQHWIHLFPLAVVGTLILLSTVDYRLFMIANYSQVRTYQLIYHYFLPLLAPGIWVVVALLVAMSPTLYYAAENNSSHFQSADFLFTLPLILLVHKIRHYRREGS